MSIIAKNNVQALIAPTRVAVLWSDARMVIAAVDKRQATSIVTADLNTAILLPMVVTWDINIISSTGLVFTVTVVVLPTLRLEVGIFFESAPSQDVNERGGKTW
jgi:hypothetical protein